MASFSHVETNPRVTVARLIMDGQYQRAAIMSGLYGVDYEELVTECGLADDPKATILLLEGDQLIKAYVRGGVVATRATTV